MPYAARNCQICGSSFVPPRSGGLLSIGDNHLRLCAGCRRGALQAFHNEPASADTPVLHASAAEVAQAPMKQVVFDLETWGLDRGWGVTLIASFLIHGGPTGPVKKTLTLRDYPAWKRGTRSDDRDLVAEAAQLMAGCHIAYAHNGDRFDMKWLRSVALKFGLTSPRIKLVDPCQLAWKRYLLGRNSLEAVADFLNLEDKGKQKMHISPDVWRRAVLDDSDEDWKLLVARCESDVDLLNEVASRVSGDVGMVDYQGSWR